MREVLFRGKKVNKDKWIYGAPVKGTPEDESEMLIIESVFECEEYLCRGCNFDPVIPETVGQFTGLTDKNGKKIFEGDIVKEIFIKDSRTYKVEFSTEYGNCGFLPFCKSDCYGEPITKAKDCEIIGNIHDNPELFEKENV